MLCKIESNEAQQRFGYNPQPKTSSNSNLSPFENVSYEINCEYNRNSLAK